MVMSNLNAQSSSKQVKKVDAKCFVELVGGGESIAFFNITEKKLATLSQSIVGYKVAQRGTKQKVNIYKAHECTLLKDDFKSKKAQRVDAKIAR